MSVIRCNKFIILLAISVSLLSNIARANWLLNNDASQLNFISTKNEHISETHSFTTLSGNLSKTGDLTVKVDLGSINTNIPIRNERMQDHLFDMENFPDAILNAKVDEQLLSLAKGHSLTKTISAKISISGITQSVNVLINATKNSDGGLTATTVRPFLIQVPAFKLTDGISKLKELAGLSSISLAVPVTFSVKFEQE